VPSRCFNSFDGALTVSASGGSSGQLGYSLYWKDSEGRALSRLYQRENTFSSLARGDYTVIVTDMLHPTLTASLSVVVLGASQPLYIAVVNTTYASNSTNPDGSITVQVGGGYGALTVSIDSVASLSSTLLANVAYGPHSLQVSDSLGCSASTAAMVYALRMESSQYLIVFDPSHLVIQFLAVCRIVRLGTTPCPTNGNGPESATHSVACALGSPPFRLETYYGTFYTGNTENVRDFAAPGGNNTITVYDSKGYSSIVNFQVPRPLGTVLNHVIPFLRVVCSLTI